MEQSREAERALVAALVLGEADPRELAGRVCGLDFADPAAGLLFDVAVAARPGPGGLAQELPTLLRREGLLRSDGYPLSRLVEWTSRLPAPAHPEAWATLVVAGSMARQVHACGVRLLQTVEHARDRGDGPGRVLATAEAQRAALVSAGRRWDRLPQRWRETVPFGRLAIVEPYQSGTASHAAEPAAAARERDLLSALVAAPQLLGRIPWLRQEDFTDRACGSLFGMVRQLHEAGHPLDVVTLSTFASGQPGAPGGAAPATVAASLRPELAFPPTVPLLARELLAHSVLIEAQAVGEDLVALASAAPSAAGVGGTLLSRARSGLESLRPHQLRVENATASRVDRSARRLARTAPLRPGLERPAQQVDRHIG